MSEKSSEKENPVRQFDFSSVQTKYNSGAEEYDAAYKGIHWELYDMITWNCIETYLPKAGPIDKYRILDAGGGTGKWTARIANLGYRVVLLDASDGMLKKAEEKLKKLSLLDRVSMEQGDITKLDFPDGIFDFVLCEGDPISYCVEKVEVALANLARVTKKKGIVQIGVDNLFQILLAPNIKSIRLIRDIIRDERPLADVYGLPVHAFKIQEIKEKLAKVGLTTIRVVGKPVTVSLVSPKDWSKYDDDPQVRQDLTELEKELMKYDELACLGGHLHVIAKK